LFDHQATLAQRRDHCLGVIAEKLVGNINKLVRLTMITKAKCPVGAAQEITDFLGRITADYGVTI
jgi:hypothetical protein